MKILKNFLPLLGLLLILHSCKKKNEPKPAGPTLLEVLSEQSDLQLYLEGLQKTGLVDSLAGKTATLLAPSDSSIYHYINQLGTVNLDEFRDLVGENRYRQIFRYHWLEGKQAKTTFENGYRPTDASAKKNLKLSLFVQRLDEDVLLNAGSNIRDANLSSAQGFIHKIDRVLVPSTLTNLIRTNPDFSEFVKAIQLSGSNLEAVMNQENAEITLFAPNNAAIQNFLQTKGFTNLNNFQNAIGSDSLQAFLDYHTLPTRFPENLLIDGEYATRNPGQSLFVSIQNEEILIKTNAANFIGAKITMADIHAINGTLHSIDKVLSN